MQIVQPIKWTSQYLNNTICLAREKITIFFFFLILLESKINKQNKIEQPESEDTLQFDHAVDVAQSAICSHSKVQACIPHYYGTEKIVISPIQSRNSQKHPPQSIELQICHVRSDSQDAVLYFRCYAERFLALVQYHAAVPGPSDKTSHTKDVD